MPSTDPQDDGVAEDIQESAKAALAGGHLTMDLAAQPGAASPLSRLLRLIN
jgi:hypothetical protein